MHRLNEEGFTMLEMIIVLLFISLITLLTLPLVVKQQQLIEYQQFKRQFTGDIQYGQLYSLAYDQQVSFSISSYEGTYIVRSGNVLEKELSLVRTLPESVSLNRSSTLSSFFFTPVGTTSGFGTLYFVSGKKKLTIVFQIGRGRFVVTES